MPSPNFKLVHFRVELNPHTKLIITLAHILDPLGDNDLTEFGMNHVKQGAIESDDEVL
jgi:hypothetical protein